MSNIEYPFIPFPNSFMEFVVVDKIMDYRDLAFLMYIYYRKNLHGWRFTPNNVSKSIGMNDRATKLLFDKYVEKKLLIKEEFGYVVNEQLLMTIATKA